MALSECRSRWIYLLPSPASLPVFREASGLRPEARPYLSATSVAYLYTEGVLCLCLEVGCALSLLSHLFLPGKTLLPLPAALSFTRKQGECLPDSSERQVFARSKTPRPRVVLTPTSWSCQGGLVSCRFIGIFVAWWLLCSRPAPSVLARLFGSDFPEVLLPMVKILIYRICHGPAGVATRTTTRDLPFSSTVCAARC